MKLSEKYKYKTSQISSPAQIYNRYLINLMYKPNYQNSTKQKWYHRLLKKNYEVKKNRKIVAYYQDDNLPRNQIHTSKYKWWNFVPKNLFEQFQKLPNLYFLIIGIFQILPYTSTTSGIPSIYIPLGVIVLFTALKDLYEDYHRSISDNQQNQQQVILVSKDDSQKIIKSKKIKVGNVIKILKNEFIPCDGLILYSTQKFAYVETKNLDGETNLKRKVFLPELQIRSQNLEFCHIELQYQSPNINMNHFQGSITIDKKTILLNNNNICLRGTILKNTQYIYLLALYTGHQTKILLSMNKPRAKTSNLQQRLGYIIAFIFIIMIIISNIFAILQYYSGVKNNLVYNYNQAQLYIVVAFTWILNVSNLVPISLIVTLQAVKLLQGRLIANDPKMANQMFESIVNCSNVLEDLGVIQYIASDKTGTLTKNNLTLKFVSDGILVYDRASKNLPDNVLKILAICHQVYLSQQNQYEGLSQDQVCILEYCQIMKANLIERNEKKMIIKHQQFIHEIKIVKILEFTSQRKKQSIIYQEKGKFYIVCKGADIQMKSRIKDSENKNTIFIDLDQFASKGLRTLVFGTKQLQKDYCQQWVNKYKKAQIERYQAKLIQLELQIQSELNIVCATGIEDQLQDDVVDTVKSILKAGIKFMIISGDKPETVLAIANNLCLNQVPYLAPQNIYKQQYIDKGFLVFARCTPKEKQQIVAKLKGKTLAIGDGANDVCMLTKATIGVGIQGKQGKAAIQASDFGIPQFKYLKRLLFYYGSEINRRNGILVRYNFYKNFVYTIPQFVFGFFSYFTGMYIYETYLAQLFNLMFASLPIIIFALFDQNQDTQVLQNNLNKQYQKSREGIYFDNKSLLLTTIQSMIQTIVSSFICFRFIPTLFPSPNDLQIYETSSVLFFYVVVMVNINILYLSSTISIAILLTVIISISAFFICLYILCIISSDLFQSFSKILHLKSFFIVLLCLVFSMAIAMVIRIIKTMIQNCKNKSNSIGTVQQTNIKIFRMPEEIEMTPI